MSKPPPRVCTDIGERYVGRHPKVADPGLADRKHECDETLVAEMRQLHAVIAKLRAQLDAKRDEQRQYVANLKAAHAKGRLELRKLNDAMARKNRVIAKRVAERDPALWLHAEQAHKLNEMADFAGQQANARRESDRVRNVAAREAADLRDEVATSRQQTEDARELAEMRAEDRTKLDLKLEDVTAERDQLQAHIDAATAELKKWDALATRESEWLPCRAGLAALQGDQPEVPGD